jgi:hypothetical protein
MAAYVTFVPFLPATSVPKLRTILYDCGMCALCVVQTGKNGLSIPKLRLYAAR